MMNFVFTTLAAFIIGCLAMASNEHRANMSMMGMKRNRLLNYVPELLLALAILAAVIAGIRL